MVAQDEPRILVPRQSNDFLLPVGPDVKLHVVEMPMCRFNGLPVCLASTNQLDVPKMGAMQGHFLKVWSAMQQLIEQGKIERP